MSVLPDKKQKSQECCDALSNSPVEKFFDALSSLGSQHRTPGATAFSAILNQTKPPHERATPKIHPTGKGGEKKLLVLLHEEFSGSEIRAFISLELGTATCLV